MNNLNQSLNYPTITGLKSLELDDLNVLNLNADIMDGNIIYYNKIEGNEVIVDTRLTLTNTGVISVGNSIISDIELTYLDGTTSNIQQQINNIYLTSSGIISTVNLHSLQISDLFLKDLSQNIILNQHTNQLYSLYNMDLSQNLLLNQHTNQLYSLYNMDLSQNLLLNQHTNQLYSLYNMDLSQNVLLNQHTTDINYLNYAVTGQAATLTTHTSQIAALQSSDSTQNTNITNLQTSDAAQNTLLSTHTAQISALQTSDSTQNTNITNLQASDSAQNTNISNLQASDATQNTNITTLQNKTQNITATTTETTMSKPLFINASGQCLKMTGNHNYITAFDSTTLTRDFYIGTPNNGDKTLRIVNEKTGVLYLSSGTDGIENNPGRNKIQTYSKGIQFYRGGSTIDYGGEIGMTAGGGDKTLWIKSSLIDDIVIRSGTGNIYLDCPDLRVGAATEPYTKISFMDNGQWVPQISPFTETLKTQITTNKNDIATINTEITTIETDIAVLKTKIQSQIIRIDIPTTGASNGNVLILGRTQTLTPSTNYTNVVHSCNLGVLLHNNGGLGAILFNSLGQWVYTGGATQRVSVQFDTTFTSLSTGIKIFTTRLYTLPQTGALTLFNSRPMGVNYNQGGGNPLNAVLHVSTGQFIVDISNLNRLFLETQNFFSTSGDGASVATSGRLTFYLLPY